MSNPNGKPVKDAGFGEVVNDANQDIDKPVTDTPTVDNENNTRVASIAKAKREGDKVVQQQSNSNNDNPGQEVRLSILDQFMEQFKKKA